MRDIQILQQTIENQCPEIHKKRLRSLILATKAVLDGSDLTLTKIGRALDTDTTVKHAIKRIDRLLGNRNLHREKESIYKWHASFITRANPFPVVLVDWSDVREQLRYMTLRASVSVKGRARFMSRHLSTKTITHRRAINTFSISFSLCSQKVAHLSLSPTQALEILGFGKSPTKVGSGLDVYVAKSRLNVVNTLGNGIKRFTLKQQISRSF